jgi:hypothetical protein
VQNLEKFPPDTIKLDMLERARVELASLRAELKAVIATDIHAIEQLREKAERQAVTLSARYIGEMVTPLNFHLRRDPADRKQWPLDSAVSTYPDRNNPKERPLVQWIARVNRHLEAATRSWDEVYGLSDRQLSHCSKLMDGLNEEGNKKDKDKPLRRAVQITLAGMIGCWVAQWVFWVGFVRLHQPDQ